jgi:hypothetical protein
MRIGYQQRTTAGDKTIHLPLPVGVEYDTWLQDQQFQIQKLNPLKLLQSGHLTIFDDQNDR